MIEHSINKLNNFISGWFIDATICTEIINYHKNNPNKKSGVTNKGVVDPLFKTSTDCVLENDILIEKYVYELQKCAEQYVKQYNYCDYYSPWTILENINIQHYSVGEAYHGWHTERVGNQEYISARHLVFMTYLNDVDDGGETEWYYQKIKVKPQKGLTVIWPADWTFTHRGLPSNSNDKYIITGWFSYK